MQILLLNLYPPVEKKGFTVSTKGFSVELSTGIAMMKHGSSTVHIKTVLCRHRFLSSNQHLQIKYLKFWGGDS